MYSFLLDLHCKVVRARSRSWPSQKRHNSCLLKGGIFLANLMMYSDSKDAIRSITNVSSTFTLVRASREFLTEISCHSNVILSRFPGHRARAGKGCTRAFNCRHTAEFRVSDCPCYTEHWPVR